LYHRKHTHHHIFLGFHAPSLLSSSSTSKNARLAVVCALQVLASDLVKLQRLGFARGDGAAIKLALWGFFFLGLEERRRRKKNMRNRG
jgi:hypothetical protein